MASTSLDVCHLFVIFYCCLFSSLLSSTICVNAERVEEYDVTHLRLDDVNMQIEVNVDETTKDNNLEIFCYTGEEKHLLNIWKTISMRIFTTSQNFEVFQGENASKVVQHYKESQGLFFYAMPISLRSSRVEFSLYNASCIGVHSDSKFIVALEVNYIDFWKILRLSLGIFLFFAAPYLSCNLIFYYSSGVIFGIFASLLIFVFVLSRFIPRRVGAISVLVGGWAIVLYFFQLLFSNIKDIALLHQNIVMAYILIVGFISFGICYKYGQVTDPRTQNLIKWTLQAIGLLLVFFSAEWKEATMSIVLMLLFFYNFPAKWTAAFRTFWRRRFPPKIRLLSEDEYHDQVVAYTKNALEDLRKHCSSPQCKPWKYIKKLKSPLRFADFVEGNSHLTDDEVLNYEMDQSGTITDDDDSFSENSDMDYNNGNAVLL